MAQSEDVELRDLVIDALDKNGSLPKIRALLRANIFLAFEEECENIKQNPILDGILQTQEGLLILSLVHEFLEFCNLRNTMFVYVSESRQGKEYKYEGRKRLAEKFINIKHDKEPILISILKTIIASHSLHDNVKKKTSSFLQNGMKVDENCTYIVHEDSSSISSQSNSQSDKSSDEKHKSMLRLSLDNSDTDTSSDSARDKTSSEYIANENIIVDGDSDDDDSKKSLNISQLKKNIKPKTDIKHKNINDVVRLCSYSETGFLNPYTSSDSTSYLDLHTFKNARNSCSTNDKSPTENISKHVSEKSSKMFSSNEHKSLNLKSSEKHAGTSNETSNNFFKNNLDDTRKTEIVTSDYSNDFTSSPVSVQDSKELRNDDINGNSHNSMNATNTRQDSSSSRSSVSISDVADLIDFDSSNSPIKLQKSNSDDNISCSVKKKLIDLKSTFKKTSYDYSDDSIVSSIPSLSNLSFDGYSEERL